MSPLNDVSVLFLHKADKHKEGETSVKSTGPASDRTYEYESLALKYGPVTVRVREPGVKVRER